MLTSAIGIFAPADVRPVLKHYAGKDIPREYAKKEAEAKAAAVAEWERTHPTGSGGGSWLSGVFGGSSAVSILVWWDWSTKGEEYWSLSWRVTAVLAS